MFYFISNRKFKLPAFHSMLVAGILILSFLTVACKKDDEKPKPDPVKTPSEIANFIWAGLHDYYLWYNLVPDLSDSKYKTTEELNTFLLGYTDEEDLFYDLLYQYGTVDKWSFIVDDYKVLEDNLAGIYKTMGFDFGLVRYTESGLIFGFVRYVLKGSPADLAGIKRGDIFTKIDNQNLDINNYQDLLFGSDSYTLSFAKIENNTISSNGISHTLTAVEMQENPIFYDTIMDLNGIKTAYLVYNAFTSDFDDDLNELFGKYKTEGIQKMILDLRYNGGGSILSCTHLASMIYAGDESKVFCKRMYNNKLQSYLEQSYGGSFFNYTFSDSVLFSDTEPAIPVNSLGLSSIYFLVTNGTASASELLINGLKPYMQVKLVGENTHGKYVGSITLKDFDEEGILNPNHTWAMQPIVLKISNSLGVSDYVNGLPADITAEEDIIDLLPFGDPNEPMLKAAVNDILGVPAQKSFKTKSPLVSKGVFKDSKDFQAFRKEMFLNDLSISNTSYRRWSSFRIP